MTPLERAQRVASVLAVAGAGLGFLTASGCQVLPGGEPGWAALLHPLLILAGGLCGAAAVARGREIDARRWQIVEDSALTSGEREWAHKEAERQRRVAGTSFLLGSLGPGYWAAYQIQIGEETRTLLASLLTVSPLLGFFAGVLLWSRRPPKPPA